MKQIHLNKIICTGFLLMTLCCHGEYNQQSLPKYFSNSGQDKYMYEHFFKNKRHGVFVDIGAHNGVEQSNSFFFEKQLDWTGICVEPLPEVFAQLKKNRNCICIHGCVAEFNGLGKFLRISDPERLSGLIDYYDPRHMDRIDREVHQLGGTKNIIEMRCYTLENILEKHGVFHIDYLSIDTEGNELAILESIDFDKFYIDVIDIENNYYCKKIRKFLEKKGYRYITRLRDDEIYRKISTK